MSVVEFWDKKYLPYVTDQKRPSTVDGYTKMWRRYLKDRMGMPIRDFRTVRLRTAARWHVVAKYDV